MEASRATTAAGRARARRAQVVARLRHADQAARSSSLLLLTTITTMYVAGDPSVGARGAHGASAAPVGGRRGRGQPLVRPRHRRRDGAHGRRGRCRRAGLAARRADLRARAAGAVVRAARRWPSTCSAPCLALAGFLWYALVYTVWLKRRSPQNIVIGGAAGAVPPLVGWAAVTGSRRPGGAVPVRDRLLLDAAALLGAVAADEGRVRARRRADDAGRPRRGRDAPPDRPLHAAADRADAAAGRRSASSARSTRVVGRRPRRRVHRARACACSARADRAQRAAHLPVLARPTSRCCSPRWSLDARL